MLPGQQSFLLLHPISYLSQTISKSQVEKSIVRINSIFQKPKQNEYFILFPERLHGRIGNCPQHNAHQKSLNEYVDLKVCSLVVVFNVIDVHIDRIWIVVVVVRRLLDIMFATVAGILMALFLMARILSS